MQKQWATATGCQRPRRSEPVGSTPRCLVITTSDEDATAGRRAFSGNGGATVGANPSPFAPATRLADLLRMRGAAEGDRPRLDGAGVDPTWICF
jgi:hypothetical protein